jgi:GT2 family glycosyltransferase
MAALGRVAESGCRMSDLVMCVATRRWNGWFQCIRSWGRTSDLGHKVYVVPDEDVLPAYQKAYSNTSEPILGMCHDDLMIYEQGWDTRVLEEFHDPGVGVVGFAGAIGHGSPDLYRVPYHLPNLARQTFLSNLRDAETHGQRFKGARDVAILDGMALFVRRPILDKVGGWPLDKPIGYWLYAEWLCCEARRQGFRIRLVGVDCEHLGGKSSAYIAKSPTYEEAHWYLFDTNRDVLPHRVKD